MYPSDRVSSPHFSPAAPDGSPNSIGLVLEAIELLSKTTNTVKSLSPPLSPKHVCKTCATIIK